MHCGPDDTTFPKGEVKYTKDGLLGGPVSTTVVGPGDQGIGLSVVVRIESAPIMRWVEIRSENLFARVRAVIDGWTEEKCIGPSGACAFMVPPNSLCEVLANVNRALGDISLYTGVGNAEADTLDASTSARISYRTLPTSPIPKPGTITRALVSFSNRTATKGVGTPGIDFVMAAIGAFSPNLYPVGYANRLAVRSPDGILVLLQPQEVYAYGTWYTPSDAESVIVSPWECALAYLPGYSTAGLYRQFIWYVD